MAKVRATLPKGTPIEIWFQDEARVGQKNKITRRWARRGTRPSAPKDQRTKSAYIFGAICPELGKGAGLVLPFCNTETMALHLAEISLAIAPGAHGGVNATEMALDEEFVAQVRQLALGARYITSVCTGSLILGAAGLLTGKHAACHWAWRDLLVHFGAIPDPARVVQDGNLITGGGVTAGIDFALTVLAEIADSDLAQTIQLGLEYAPAPPFTAGRPESAPAAIVAAYRARMAPLAASREAQARQAAVRIGVGASA